MGLMPSWAQRPDSEYLDAMERLRRRYAWRLDCKPIVLNEGTPNQEPFTVELALAWAERWAAEALA